MFAEEAAVNVGSEGRPDEATSPSAAGASQYGLGPAEGHDAGPEPGTRSRHSVVTAAMDPWGRDEVGEGVEESFRRRLVRDPEALGD